MRRLIPARPIVLEPVLAHPEFAKDPGVSISTADTMFHSLPTHSIPGLGSLTAVTYRLLRSFPILSCLLSNKKLTAGSYDNDYAIKQIENGHHALLSRTPATDADKAGPSLNGKTLPRVITLGGDHTIVLPILRSVKKLYGPISVIHFDSHLDTWKPKVFGGSLSKTASVNHGTYFVSSTSHNSLIFS